MTAPLDLDEVRGWVADAVGPVRSLVVRKERAWATVARATVGARGRTADVVWFKACAPVQAFEPHLTFQLAGRWPDRVARVLAVDEARAWLLTADAGRAIGSLGNPPEVWLRALPRYAELQRGEMAHAPEHLAAGVPDLRLASLPGGFDALVESDMPMEAATRARLRRFRPHLAALCDRLAASGPHASIQHDDLHVNGIFLEGDQLRVLDWGDASVAHPFFSLVVTFWFLERENGLAPDDPWFARLRDAYLEPWGGPPLRDVFDLAFRVGVVTHPIGWLRHRSAMPPRDRREFDRPLAGLLAWVLARAAIP